MINERNQNMLKFLINNCFNNGLEGSIELADWIDEYILDNLSSQKKHVDIWFYLVAFIHLLFFSLILLIKYFWDEEIKELSKLFLYVRKEYIDKITEIIEKIIYFLNSNENEKPQKKRNSNYLVPSSANITKKQNSIKEMKYSPYFMNIYAFSLITFCGILSTFISTLISLRKPIIIFINFTKDIKDLPQRT